MYKFFECENYNKIFWNNETENKPDLLFMASLSWKEITTQFDYVSQFDTKINYPTDLYYENKPNYFKVKTGEFERYYFVTSTSNENVDTITLNLTLDVWATYTLPALAANSDKSIDIVRSHLTNELAYQLNDSLLDTVPITYKETIINREYYEFIENDNDFVYKINPSGIYSDEELLVNKQDILNANIYYVFKSIGVDNANNDYFFIPVLSNKLSQKYRRGYPATEELLYSLDMNFNNAQLTALQKYQELVSEYGAENLQVKYSNSKIPTDTSLLNIKVDIINEQKCNVFGTASASAYSYTYFKLYYNNEIIDSQSTYNSKGQAPHGYCHTYPAYPLISAGIVYIYLKSGVRYETITINNYLVNINNLINKPNLANNFMGKYISCNFLNLYKQIEVINNGDLNNVLVFRLGVNGTYINNLKLNSFDLNTYVPDRFNSLDINNRIIFNYFKLKYLNFDFHTWNYFINKEGEILLNGLFLFNGAPSIIIDNNLLTTEESILTLPYQIPSAQDEYVLYYSNVMSQVNTGLEQSKVNYNLQLGNIAANGLLGVAGNALNYLKNPIGAVAGGIQSVFSTGMGIAQNRIQLQQYRDSVAAKFSDIKRNSGASFAPSNIKDAATLLYSVSNDKYNETCEIKVPTDDTIRLLNNILYLYGNITPFNIKVKDCFPRNNFNYLQVNQNWLNTNLCTWLAGEPSNIVDIVAASLANGVRVWRVFPNYDIEN